MKKMTGSTSREAGGSKELVLIEQTEDKEEQPWERAWKEFEDVLSVRMSHMMHEANKKRLQNRDLTCD